MTSRMLLTSAGISNETLRAALADLLGRPFNEARLAVVLTASLAVPGDKTWLLDDLARLRALWWAEIDVVDLHTLLPDGVAARLRAADVVYVHGGNQYNLAAAIDRRGLALLFRELVQTKVYVGLSAGSMILSRHLADGVAVFGDEDEVRDVGLRAATSPLPLFDWYLKPHLDSPDRPETWARERAAAADFPIWFLDDASALLVRGERGSESVELVGEGRGLLLEA
ncbi:MAG: Type 1 glutamine amidotransferase-like domain-containing protein [Nocardioides sp.]|nr:Type 1 glutamine amidotransferase-like domain-containing protein [Nocardioides sp.]